MKRFAYRSFVSPNIRVSEVVTIVDEAQVSNKKNGITGLLLFDGRAFFQILEGEDAPALDLFEKIKNDPRHREIDTLFVLDIKERDFAEWSMMGKLLPRDVDNQFSMNNQIGGALFLPPIISAESTRAIDSFIFELPYTE